MAEGEGGAVVGELGWDVVGGGAGGGEGADFQGFGGGEREGGFDGFDARGCGAPLVGDGAAFFVPFHAGVVAAGDETEKEAVGLFDRLGGVGGGEHEGDEGGLGW